MRNAAFPTLYSFIAVSFYTHYRRFPDFVNAVDYCDLKEFSIALYRAMKRGKNFLFRTAANLVNVMGGIS